MTLITNNTIFAQNCDDVITQPNGFVESNDKKLLFAAIGAPGKGKLRKGKVFKAEKSITIYRVWDDAKSHTLWGIWWTLDVPQGTRDEYRIKNAICPEWSQLNIMSSCTIKIGTKVVIGPGQSVKCKDGSVIPDTSTLQVYIPNDIRNNVFYIEDCTAGTVWP